MGQIEVKLFAKTDKRGDEYMIGSTELPVLVDLSKVTLLVFYPEENKDVGTLLIRPYKPKSHYDREPREQREEQQDGPEVTFRHSR